MYLSDSELNVELLLNTRVINDVLVNPKTKGNVVVQHKVEDCTTANVGITIPVTRCKADVTTTKENIGDDVINGVGGLSVNHE